MKSGINGQCLGINGQHMHDQNCDGTSTSQCMQRRRVQDLRNHRAGKLRNDAARSLYPEVWTRYVAAHTYHVGIFSGALWKRVGGTQAEIDEIKQEAIRLSGITPPPPIFTPTPEEDAWYDDQERGNPPEPTGPTPVDQEDKDEYDIVDNEDRQEPTPQPWFDKEPSKKDQLLMIRRQHFEDFAGIDYHSYYVDTSGKVARFNNFVIGHIRPKSAWDDGYDHFYLTEEEVVRFGAASNVNWRMVSTVTNGAEHDYRVSERRDLYIKYRVGVMGYELNLSYQDLVNRGWRPETYPKRFYKD